MLALQRSAGNRATAAAVAAGRSATAAAVAVPGGLIQRRLNFDPAMLGKSSREARFKAKFGGEDTYRKINDALVTYRGSYKIAEQVALLAAMLALIVKWMEGNKKARSTGGDRITKLRRLAEVIYLEWPNAERQAKYMGDLPGKGEARTGGKFKYISDSADLAIDSAKKNAAGTTGAKAEIELMKKYDLNDAEMAAIKIYTVDDFRYINPALAGNDAWLASQIPKISGTDERAPSRDVSPGGLRQATSEGKRHAGVAVEGLKKLPPWKGLTFRGLSLTPAEFRQQFVDTKQFATQAFLSTSTQQHVSEVFAKPSDEKPVGILITYEVTNGRDILPLALIKGEEEVLLLPGATFTITAVRERSLGGHRAGGKKTYDVTMKQTA